jgi:hypothetical protein
MELNIERAHLIPQPIQLARKRVRRHVVLGAPHGPGVREAKLLGALVRQLDEPHVVLPHGRGNRMPPFPLAAELRLVPRVRQDTRHVVNVVTGLRLRRVTTPLAFSVRPPEPRCNRGQLLRFPGIGRRGEDERHFQHVELTSLVGRHLHPIEFRRLLRKSRRGVSDLPRCARVDRFGIVGDEVLGNPSGLSARDRQTFQRVVHGRDKGGCLGRRRLRGGLGRPGTAGRCAHNDGAERDE